MPIAVICFACLIEPACGFVKHFCMLVSLMSMWPSIAVDDFAFNLTVSSGGYGATTLSVAVP